LVAAANPYRGSLQAAAEHRSSGEATKQPVREERRCLIQLRALTPS
jgi:hypothetical protein